MAKKWVRSALAKILIGIGACVLAVAVVQLATRALITGHPTLANVVDNVAAAVLVLTVYIYLFRRIEKREITELKAATMPRNLLLGILLGFSFQSAVILVMYVVGSYTIVGVNSFASLLPALIISISSGVVEEILCRGIILRITEEKLGTWWALAISSLLFGLAHLFNPNASLYSAIAISIEAGLFLGACYVFSRSLWLPIGLHFAWNFTESGIYGGNVSGFDLKNSLFTARFSGNEYITGGSFGPENSIQALVIGLLAAVYFLMQASKKGQLIKPYWKNKAVAA